MSIRLNTHERIALGADPQVVVRKSSTTVAANVLQVKSNVTSPDREISFSRAAAAAATRNPVGAKVMVQIGSRRVDGVFKADQPSQNGDGGWSLGKPRIEVEGRSYHLTPSAFNAVVRPFGLQYEGGSWDSFDTQQVYMPKFLLSLIGPIPRTITYDGAVLRPLTGDDMDMSKNGWQYRVRYGGTEPLPPSQTREP